MKLFEISQAYRDWQLKVEMQDGEVTDEDIQELMSIDNEADNKIDACCVLIKEARATAEIYKQEADKLRERAEKEKHKAERITSLVDRFLREQGRDKFKSEKAVVGYRKSTILEIEENTEIPQEYKRIKEEIDKASIKDLLKQGGTLKGCSLVEKTNINIK